MKNKQIESILKSTVASNRVVNGYIFLNTGKCEGYKYAKEFAKMILCLDFESYPNDCKSCLMFDDENHSDYYEINKEKTESIKIDEIREMQTKIFEKPITSNHKVYLINNSEQMTKEAQNALLKTLEEPPEFVTIILVCNNESTIYPTIKSRCTKVVFTEETLEEFTEEEHTRYAELEKVFSNIDNYLCIDLLNKFDVLYKDKDNVLQNLDYINMILIKSAKENPKYLDYIEYVEETKNKIKRSNNFDMCIDYLILNIFK